MEVGFSSTLLAGDPRLVDHIVGEVKSQGIFDQFRKECIADVDTKPAYQNLRSRVEGSVNTFLSKQIWKPDMNKNQLRETLRKHIHDAAYLDAGVERIVDQVVNPKVYSIFMPQIEDVVYKFLGIERPKEREKNGATMLKDLLPKDLDPVSPESDKNSLKDISLESTDAGINDKSETINDVTSKYTNKSDANLETDENGVRVSKDTNSTTKFLENMESQLELDQKVSAKNTVATMFNILSKSEDKVEDDEEDSPTFEPIDIMNMNESNDSHLSGISELTSHRSRSPNFSNDFSRDNLDFSNQDSQLSKVSSDSRLSIVTDFGSSNHASTLMTEVLKEDSNKAKSVDFASSKSNKDNFKVIRDIQSNKANAKDVKGASEILPSKENVQETKDGKDTKNSRVMSDFTDFIAREKSDPKDLKDRNKDDSSKNKLHKDRTDPKESKTKDKDKDYRKRPSSHSSSKHDKSHKNSRDKTKDKAEKPRDSSDKHKDASDKSKDIEKTKEDRKETDKSDNFGKDLKDIYKEKIRELREKKELTEKEKLSRDNKDSKSSKDTKERKDSSRDRKDSRSSSMKSSGRHEEKSVSKNDGKTSNKGVDGKDSKGDSKDRGKREEKRHSRESKESRSRNHTSTKSEHLEKTDKLDSKKEVKSKDIEGHERNDMRKDTKLDGQRSDSKKDSKLEMQSDGKKDSKYESQSKDKRRKDDKKNKSKDDHFSMRKPQNDRRSTDRDGSNGSNSKNSQNSSSNSTTTSTKVNSTAKESSGTSNSSSETSDNVDDLPSNGSSLPNESMNQDSETKSTSHYAWNQNDKGSDMLIKFDLFPKKVDLGQAELSLPLKKRPLFTDPVAPNPDDFKVKKPKFAKNFHEAKKLMKIRKKLEKQRLQKYEAAKERFQMASGLDKTEKSTIGNDTGAPSLPPDDERVQIIEIADDEYEEPYPDLSMKHLSMTLEEPSLITLQNSLGFNCQDRSQQAISKPSDYSEMEESIKRSLEDLISDKKLLATNKLSDNNDDSTNSPQTLQNEGTAMSEQILQKSTRDEKSRTSIDEVQEPTKDENTAAKSTSIISEDNTSSNNSPSRKVITEQLDQCNEKKNCSRSLPTLNTSNFADSISPRSIEKNRYNVFNETSRSPRSEDSYCLYLEADNERALKFSKYVQSLESEISEVKAGSKSSTESLETILESLGGQIVSSLSKTMAPPMSKRKLSTSPLSDIILNNSNNNNIRQKIVQVHSPTENDSNILKKRKFGRPKKQQHPQQRAIANVCAIQNLPNGENFVMPLSPESDVSASSEKTSMHPLKEERSRQRSSQRYSSDDLYKPRPFFSSSSRRSRRSDQA